MAEVRKFVRDEKPAPEQEAKLEEQLKATHAAFDLLVAQNPNHAGVRLTYGSFLFELDENEAAGAQWQEASKLDPKNPLIWDCLAQYQAEVGTPAKAFVSLEKAIALAPDEPAYLLNLALCLDLFPEEARQHYRLEAAEVQGRIILLYQRAMKLGPRDFVLATEYAQLFYGFRPFREREALAAWNYALSIAHDNEEQQGILIHLARVAINAGAFNEAAQHLARVNLPKYDSLKRTLLANIERRKAGDLPDRSPLFGIPNARTL